MKEVLPERRTAPSRDSSCRSRMARTPREASRPKISNIRFDDELETLDMKPGIQDRRNDIYCCDGISAVVGEPLMNDQANPQYS